MAEEPEGKVSMDVTFPTDFRDMTTMSPSTMIREAPENSFVHVDRLPGSSTAARKAASRAAKDGLLLPVRRGLYYRGRRTRYGIAAPRPEEVARTVLGTHGIGPAGYSAARAWGVTTQVPPLWYVATLRTVDPIDGVVQHDRKNLACIDLTEKEIALLELLRSPRFASSPAGTSWSRRSAPRSMLARSVPGGCALPSPVSTTVEVARE